MKKQTNKILSKLLRYERTRAQKHRGLRMEMLEGRRVMTADMQLPLHNALMAPDVNRDFSVSPIDALLVINALHAQARRGSGEGESPYTYTPVKGNFLDVSNDGKLSPLDALLVINQLRAEGEELKLVSFRIEFRNAAGGVVTQASVGETVTARVYVKDLRTLSPIIDLPDLDLDPDSGPNTFPNPNDGDIDRNGNGIFDVGPDASFATGAFSAGIDLDLTGSEPVSSLVSQVRTGSFLNSLTFGPRLSAFPDGSAGAVGSNEEFNEISAFDLDLSLQLLQDKGIDPTREELFFSARFTLLKTGAFTITPNFAETAFEDEAQTKPSLAPTIIRTFDGSLGGQIAVREAQQAYIPGTLTIVADATAPVAMDDTRSSPEDTPLILAGAGSTVSPPLIENDTVTAGRTLTVIAVTEIPGITQGTVSGLTYTPPANFVGQDRVTYTVRDNPNGLTSTATVTINVTEVNDTPVAVADSFPIPGDSTANPLNVLANDNAGGGETQTLTITLVGPTSNGGVVVNNGTSLTYTPAVGFEGTETFTYTISDGQPSNNTATATVTVTVEPATVPFARRDTRTMAEVSAGETGSVPINVLANDKLNPGVDVLPLLISFTQPANGTVTRDNGGTPDATNDDQLIYVPNFEFNGTDTFTYVMNDTVSEADSTKNSIGTVTITVTDVNDPPIAEDDNASGTEDLPVTIAISTLLLNDSPGLGETTTQAVTVSPGTSASGTVAVVGSNVVFTPNAALNSLIREITFTYVITDSGTSPLTDAGTVTVNLAAVNDAPIAGADSRSTDEDTPLTITVNSLLLNDAPGRPAATDESGQTLSITNVGATSSNLGNVSLSGGVITYTPASNFNGPDTFTYTVRDFGGATSTGTVNVIVNPINDAPVAGTDNVVAFKGVPLQISVADLLANDTTGPANANEGSQTPLRITSVFGAVNGSVSLNSTTGVITFTPVADFSGPASFQYTVQDNGPTGGLNVNSGTGTVNVMVRDFVPTDITGTVWVDETNDGVIDNAERKLGGVEVTLTGNALGIPIAARAYITLADGSYNFSNLAPGQYVVTYNRPLYMIDGRDVPGDLGDADTVANQFTINVAQPGGADADGYNFATLGIEASYGRTLDQLASRYTMTNPNLIYRGLYAAIGADNSSLWMAKLDGFDGMVTGEVVLNAAGNRLQLTMVDVNRNVYTASLSSNQFVVTTDRTTGNKLIRVLGDAASISFQQISRATPPVVSINRYLEAIDEIFAQEGWDDLL